MNNLHLYRGVGKDFKCRFDGACYGMICIAPDICSRKRVTSKKDIRFIIKFLKYQLKEQKGFNRWIKEMEHIQKKNVKSNIAYIKRKIKYYKERLLT